MAEFIVNTIEDNTATDDGDDSVITLREAVLKANDSAGADIITFDLADESPLIRLAQGEIEITGELVIDGGGVVVITGDTDENDILVEGSDITDLAETDAANLTDNTRIFNVTSDSAPLTLRDLTLTGGRTTGGLGVGDGGAVRSMSMLALDNVTLSGNSTTDFETGGGGAYAKGVLYVIDSMITGNMTGGFGGGICTYGGAYVKGSTFIGNSAGYDGGGMSIGALRTGDAMVIDSIIIGNTAEYNGGGIQGAGTIYLKNSLVSGNRANDYAGGGIYADTKLNLLNSTVTGNHATTKGGGIYAFDEVNLINSTITGNVAEESGGGIFLAPPVTDPEDPAPTTSSLYMLNTIILGNSAPSYAVVNGNEPVEGVSSIYGTEDPVDVFAETEEIAGGVRAGVLADNGGPTETVLILAGGLAHNSGTDLDLDTDQRGDPRKIGRQVDLGAVELPNHAPVAVDDAVETDSDTIVTGLVLANDGDIDENDQTVLTALTVRAVNGQEAAVGSTITLASGALLMVNANGEFSYDPNGAFDDVSPGSAETDSFEYTSTDGEFDDTAMVTLTIARQAEDTTGGGDGDGDTTTGQTQTTGTNGPDLITCQPGNDNLNGLKGRDTICGGPGDDIVLGGSGRDRLNGAAGDDLMRGAKGNDLMSGGKGNDTLLGGEGHDKTFGLAGEDELRGGSGNDTVKGGGSNDELRGGLDHDLLMGGQGGDNLFGGAGNDILHGGAGSDVLRGGLGNDRLFGDAGDDNFHFEQGHDRVHGGTGEDALIMEGDLEDYEISFGNGEVRIQRGDDMTTAVNIESLYFDDAVHLVDDLRALF